MLYIITFVFGAWLGHVVTLYTKIKQIERKIKK
jgi:hypothetical protein